MATTLVRFQWRRFTAAQWTASNPVLLQGEPGLETDTLKWKLGDGTTAWNALNYQATTVADGSLAPAKLAPGATSPDSTKAYFGDGAWKAVKSLVSYVASVATEVIHSSSIPTDIVSRFQLLADGTITTADASIGVTGVTFSGTTVTVTTSASHSYTNNDPLTITGVVGVTNVNGSQVVTGTPAVNKFTFTAGATPTGTYTSGGTVQRIWGGNGLGNEGTWNLIQQGINKVGLSIRGIVNGTANLFAVFDYKNAPIFVVPVAGGPAVFGDNFRVFNGGDVFNPTIKLRLDGTGQFSQGDPAGGSGVIAIGQALATPTGLPDGTHTLDGSVTKPGAILWSDSGGRTFMKRANGLIDPLYGSRTVGSPNVPQVGDWLLPGTETLGTFALGSGNNGWCFFVPVDVTDPSVVYNKAAALCSVAGAGGSYQQFRFGVFADDGTGTRPSLAFQQADMGFIGGNVSLLGTTPTATLTSTFSFPSAGRWWIAVAFQSSGTITTYPTLNTAQSAMMNTGIDLSSYNRGWYVTGVTGAMPTTGTLIPTQVVPFVGLRRSA